MYRYFLPETNVVYENMIQVFLLIIVLIQWNRKKKKTYLEKGMKMEEV